jgi:transcriptional regulator with XRE-family HTH domain
MSRQAENPLATPLSRLRHAVGVTTTQVSVVIGLNTGNISRLENGHNRPSIETAEKLVQYFDGAITELHLLYPERYPEWRPAEADVARLTKTFSAFQSHSKA